MRTYISMSFDAESHSSQCQIAGSKADVLDLIPVRIPKQEINISHSDHLKPPVQSYPSPNFKCNVHSFLGSYITRKRCERIDCCLSRLYEGLWPMAYHNLHYWYWQYISVLMNQVSLASRILISVIVSWWLMIGVCGVEVLGLGRAFFVLGFLAMAFCHWQDLGKKAKHIGQCTSQPTGTHKNGMTDTLIEVI